MLDKLYANIGGKLKRLAEWCFVVPTVAGVILFLVVTLRGKFLLGLLLMLLLGAVALLLSWFLYAYGELVERTCSIDENLRALSISTHEQMNRSITDAAARVRQEAADRANAQAEARQHRAEENRARFQAGVDTFSHAAGAVGEQAYQVMDGAKNFAADEWKRWNPEAAYNSGDERARRMAQREAEAQARHEAEERARQVVEERIRRLNEEKAKREAEQN